MRSTTDGDQERLLANLRALCADVERLPEIPKELAEFIAELTPEHLERIRKDVVAPLNGTLAFAAECAAAAPLPPGASQKLTGLGVGNHSFQCCIHPWMRMLIKVESEEAEEEHKH